MTGERAWTAPEMTPAVDAPDDQIKEAEDRRGAIDRPTDEPRPGEVPGIETRVEGRSQLGDTVVGPDSHLLAPCWALVSWSRVLAMAAGVRAAGEVVLAISPYEVEVGEPVEVLLRTFVPIEREGTLPNRASGSRIRLRPASGTC
jgi:hypothetical protein